jgi:hypothetical protein
MAFTIAVSFIFYKQLFMSLKNAQIIEGNSGYNVLGLCCEETGKIGNARRAGERSQRCRACYSGIGKPFIF